MPPLTPTRNSRHQPKVDLPRDEDNINAPEKFTGQAGAREFRTKYRETFGEVRSTFRNRIVNDDRAAFE